MQKNLKLKLMILAPIATGLLLLGETTRSDAFVLDTLKGLWNRSTQIVTGTLDRYVGQYVNDLAGLYVPKGLEFVSGALGLPDPGGMFDDIRVKSAQNETVNNDIAAGDSEEADVAAGTSQGLGEAILSEEGQKASKAVSDSIGAIATSSGEIAEKCQNTDITQEAIKCTNVLLANSAQMTANLNKQMQQNIQLQAAGAINNAKMLKKMTGDERKAQAEIDQRANETLNQVEYANALVDGLADQ